VLQPYGRPWQWK